MTKHPWEMDAKELWEELERLKNEYNECAKEQMKSEENLSRKAEGFETIMVAHSTDYVGNDLRVNVVSTQEGKDALDLWRIAERDLRVARHNMIITQMEFEMLLTFIRLKGVMM